MSSDDTPAQSDKKPPRPLPKQAKTKKKCLPPPTTAPPPRREAKETASAALDDVYSEYGGGDTHHEEESKDDRQSPQQEHESSPPPGPDEFVFDLRRGTGGPREEDQGPLLTAAPKEDAVPPASPDLAPSAAEESKQGEEGKEAEEGKEEVKEEEEEEVSHEHKCKNLRQYYGPYLQVLPPDNVRVMSQFRRYVTQTPQHAAIHVVILTRKKSDYYGVGPTYKLNFDHWEKDEFAIHAKRWTLPACYVMSLDPKDLDIKERNRRSQNFMGKLKVKKKGREFVQQDMGVNPNMLVEDHLQLAEQAELERGSMSDWTEGEKRHEELLDSLYEPRQELAAIIRKQDSEGNVMLSVGVPTVTGHGENTVRAKWQGTGREEKLTHNTETLGTRKLRNQLMGDRLQIFSGYENQDRMVSSKDHEGRTRQRSEKNFKITYMEGGDPGIMRCPVALQDARLKEQYLDKEWDKAMFPMIEMNKVGRETWAIRYTHPFSMLQAMGIALSRFEM